MSFSDVNTKTTSGCLNIKVTKHNGIKNVKTTIINTPLKINIGTFDKLNVKIVNATKNLNIECNVIKDDLKISLILLYTKLIVNAICVDTRPKISYNIVCGTSETAYLSVEPDIVWLSPDTLTEEFKINSNVVWKIY